MVVKSPCKDCKDRNITCHSVCEKYLDYRKRYDKMKKNEREMRKKENPYMYYR